VLSFSYSRQFHAALQNEADDAFFDDVDSAPPLFTRQASGNVVTLQYRAPEASSHYQR
jgi:hypothetical protein